MKKIDENTRVKLKFKLSVGNTVFCLQRKRQWGWKTVSWTYPSIFRHRGFDEILKHLLRQEEMKLSEKKIGDIILKRLA
jgi:hypothetical protein